MGRPPSRFALRGEVESLCKVVWYRGHGPRSGPHSVTFNSTEAPALTAGVGRSRNYFLDGDKSRFFREWIELMNPDC